MSDLPVHRRPGDRVVRRRLDATQVIPLPPPPSPHRTPDAHTHAQQFVAGFTILVGVGAVLLALPWTTESGEATPIVDAFFTAVSAASVTGLVTVDTQDHWNFLGELIILLLIQAGGLGFMVGASLVLLSLRRGTSLSDTLLIQEGAPARSPREATQLWRRILRFTLLIELTGAVLLTVRFARDEPVPEAIWDGVFHAVSAFCNAGFDLQGGFRSLLGYERSVFFLVTFMVLIQAGTLSYMALSETWAERSWRTLVLDTRLVLVINAILLVAGTVGFLALEWNAALADTPTWAKPLSALFQSVAARTAGFATVPIGEMQASTLFLWNALMLVGGASGSTAGGVKLATLGVVVVAMISTLRGYPEAQLWGRRIATSVIFRGVAVIALFLIAHFLITLLLMLTEDVFNARRFSFIDLMFEAMSGLATVGLSTGITPELSPAGKLVLCVAMFLGRLGPLTAVYALQRRQRPTRYRLPQTFIRIG